ncbi:MAG TPA: hypothetical protein VGG10_18790 [Rhizomicrobium sp.]|jgi:hypothetical protein
MLATFYSIQVRLPGEGHAYHAEGPVPETQAEALAAIAELPRDWQVIRVVRVHDGVATDVTNELARSADHRWRAAGNHPALDPTPQFVADHADAA